MRGLESTVTPSHLDAPSLRRNWSILPYAQWLPKAASFGKLQGSLGV